jgi:hypothetical protein
MREAKRRPAKSRRLSGRGRRNDTKEESVAELKYDKEAH